MIITAPQLRAARGLLDWTRADLAKAANISPETVKNIEHGTFRPQEGTADAIIQAFLIRNVHFTDNEGVQIRQELVRTFFGDKGYVEFLDDICASMRRGGKTRQFNFSDSIISTHGPEHLEKYAKEMAAIPNLDAKCLVPEGDYNMPVKHCEYKWLKKIHKNVIPYFLYGSKIAMMVNTPKEEMTWVVINSEALAQAFIQQFDVYWGEGLTVASRK